MRSWVESLRTWIRIAPVRLESVTDFGVVTVTASRVARIVVRNEVMYVPGAAVMVDVPSEKREGQVSRRTSFGSSMDNVASRSRRVALILAVRLVSNAVLFGAKATAGVIGFTTKVPPKSFIERPLD